MLRLNHHDYIYIYIYQLYSKNKPKEIIINLYDNI